MSNTRIKILYMDFAMPHLLKDSDFPTGGAAVEWLSWMEGIKLNGHTAGLLTWKGAKKYINKDPGFDIIESFELNKGIPFFRIFYYWFPKVYAAVKKYNPDVVVQEGSGVITFLGALSAKILGKKFIYRVASDKDVDERIKKKLNQRERFFYHRGLRITDIFLCQNEYQNKTLMEKFPQKKSAILYNPFMTGKDLLPVNGKDRSYVAWIGNFRYEKNIADLLPVAKSFPGVKFKIAGIPSGNIDKISLKAVEELKSLENVEFVGYLKRSEIIPFLSEAIALICTSYLEGFSNTFLEAWAAGTPVVTTQNVNPDNLINKYELGKVAETYEELPRKLRILIESNQDEEIHKRCREYVEKNHNPEILAGRLIDLIKQYKKRY